MTHVISQQEQTRSTKVKQEQYQATQGKILAEQTRLISHNTGVILFSTVEHALAHELSTIKAAQGLINATSVKQVSGIFYLPV